LLCLDILLTFGRFRKAGKKRRGNSFVAGARELGDRIVAVKEVKMSSGDFVRGLLKRRLAARSHLKALHSSTLSNGLADQGRKRLIVNFVFWPGSTSARR